MMVPIAIGIGYWILDNLSLEANNGCGILDNLSQEANYRCGIVDIDNYYQISPLLI